ncbi:MAG: nucleoside hydrolase [Colwellia sp.]|nr:nucleoside hydrolase [Colwellia sp.]
MQLYKRIVTLVVTLMLTYTAAVKASDATAVVEAANRISIIIDSDANNELDDQHALAYAFFSSSVFDVLGVTVNNTYNGDGVQGQYDEAERVMKLCKVDKHIPLFKGADRHYNIIAPKIQELTFDGQPAVDFIISSARAMKGEKLVLIPIGKLTNIALAILKAPDIIPKVRVVWLGSNYPAAGEYNLVNDVTAVNPVIESGVQFEMVTVRYDDPTGTAAVIASIDKINKVMPNIGPSLSEPITGRDGDIFSSFGDYSVALFQHVKTDRSMYDMVALAIVKNKSWGNSKVIPAPKLIDTGWVEQPENKNTIVIWENFDKKLIMEDFYHAMINYDIAAYKN